MTALLLHIFPTFAVGGPQIRFSALANHFGRRWRHAIVSLDGDVACRDRLNPGLDISFPEICLPKGSTLRNLFRCRAAIRALSPTVMVTTNWGSIEWAMANKLPLVRHLHVEEGLGPDEVLQQHRRRMLTRRLILQRSTVIVPSHGLERKATETWHLPRQKVVRVTNGVDLRRFTPSMPPQREQITVGTVAALRPEKNIDRLLQAFCLLRARIPARLVIVGGGPALPSLQKRAAELGLAAEVAFLGPTAAPEVAYASFDIFALSSDTEEMPLSVLEAMASGLPIVSTDVGDIRSMLAEANLPFVTPKNAEAMAAGLLVLASDTDLRRLVGGTNRARAEREYDQEKSFRTWAALLDGTSDFEATTLSRIVPP